MVRSFKDGAVDESKEAMANIGHGKEASVLARRKARTGCMVGVKETILSQR